MYHNVTHCAFMQKDDLDGEIDLKSCVKVSEYDVEKNYGFQIHVRTLYLFVVFMNLDVIL